MISLNAVVATATGTEFAGSLMTNIQVHVYAASGTSSSTVLIEGSVSPTAPFTILDTITNADSVGILKTYDRPFARVRVRCSAYTSGTLTGEIVGYNAFRGTIVQ